MGSLPARWLPVDPELTQPGNRPSLVPTPDELPEPVPPRPKKLRSWWVAAALGLVLMVAGGVGGFAWWRGTHDTKTFQDEDGTLSVTVPSSWARDVSLAGWRPPDSTFTQSALAVGDRGDWRASGQGVFVGLLPESKLPKTLPQHPTCAKPGTTEPSSQGNPALTSISTGCPGRRDHRARGPGEPEPTAVGAGPQPRPEDRGAGARLGPDLRLAGLALALTVAPLLGGGGW